MPGSVVTFYSYKGGVGRSFTLANVAVLLARWGYRVLCVDWDLEAPGLHDYFEPLLPVAPRSGVVDLVDDFLAGRVRPADHTTHLNGEGRLDLIAAGRMDAEYVGRVQEIDWAQLYDRGFADYLEQCRERWTTDYDCVLIDSRTGVSDSGGICTAHLPDRLVVLFTANNVSIRGAVDMANRANAARDRMPYDRPQLTVLPILSRFDAREEYQQSEQWRRTCLIETRQLYYNWLDSEVSVDLMSRQFTLPYVSFWSFGEQLPVVTEPQPVSDQISYSLETVAAVIAHGFDRTDLLAENRDAYVSAARDTTTDFPHDIRISSPRSTLELAREVIAELAELGVRAELSISGDRSWLDRAKDDARNLCLMVDHQVSRWQTAEVEVFLHRTLGQDRRLIPVLSMDTELGGLPGYLGNLRHLRFGRDAPQLARALVAELDGAPAPVVPDQLRRAVTDPRLPPDTRAAIEWAVKTLESTTGKEIE
jgi:MinD-like ATPase involved in chromosome partitioning or flagellar assembly